MGAAGLVAEAFALGVSSGPVCLASCSPVLLPVLAVERRSPKGTGVLLAGFLAGRLGGYLVFACVAWLVGLTLALPPRARSIAFGASDLAMAVLLVVYGLTLRHRRDRDDGLVAIGGAAAAERGDCPVVRARPFAARFGTAAPIALGFVSGISLCPPFVAAGVRAAQAAGLANALLFFVCFFVGTAIWFAPSVGLTLLRRIEPVAVVARLVLFLLAGYYGYLTLIVLGGLFIHG